MSIRTTKLPYCGENDLREETRGYIVVDRYRLTHLVYRLRNIKSIQYRGHSNEYTIWSQMPSRTNAVIESLVSLSVENAEKRIPSAKSKCYLRRIKRHFLAFGREEAVGREGLWVGILGFVVEHSPIKVLLRGLQKRMEGYAYHWFAMTGDPRGME